MTEQKILRQKMIENGVKFVDADTVYLREDTVIAAGVMIEPFVVFGEKVSVDEGTVIKAFSHLENVVIEKNCLIGPFARIRSGSVIKDNGGVGNFVEIARSTIGKKTAAWHLTYIADAEVGDNVEIGGGLVTSNYDGFNKYKTVLKDNCFVGANTTLIAPITVGEGALVAAGSVVTKDVEKDALVVVRAEPVVKPEGAKRYMERKKASIK